MDYRRIPTLLDSIQAELATLRQQVKIAREALLMISGAHYNCFPKQMWMPMQNEATRALKLMDHPDAG